MSDDKKPKRERGLDHFFFGYQTESNARFGHFVKRVIWCLIVIAAIKFWGELLWGLLAQKDFGALPMVFPAIVATGIAVLFCNFE